ncbi:HdeD family acid-resistance protein [Paracoccus albus]|uniref:HdeD family acid-resistance protein n=1 Tax=Paracoccus albus TaxID=3017784 RepID=UPI0022F0B292|nr:DUF308 domain-containing protein [Paracoccus albus]WBU60107.1 DUF308 domain-containing protein [Paracoccus albus]
MAGKIFWIIIGCLSILAGFLALANPLAATITAEQVAGWSFLFIGILQIVAVFQQTTWGGRIWVILLGVLFVLLGISLIANPLEGVITLTLTVAALFLVTGIFKIVLSFSLRGVPAFWLVLLSGAVSVILAVMIFGNFPASALTILGILLAVELISSGISLIALSTVRPATT